MKWTPLDMLKDMYHFLFREGMIIFLLVFLIFLIFSIGIAVLMFIAKHSVWYISTSLIFLITFLYIYCVYLCLKLIEYDIERCL